MAEAEVAVLRECVCPPTPYALMAESEVAVLRECVHPPTPYALARSWPSIRLGRMGYRLEVNVDDCMSSGKCVGDYPNTFDFDDDELATLIVGGEAMTDENMVRAARNCPSRAIQVFDDDGNQIAT